MKLLRSQRGFTLLETVLAMAVGGILVSGIVTAIYQTIRVTTETTTQITATEDIRSAAYWLTNDIKMAAATNLEDGAPAVSSLTLDWTSWYDENGQLTGVDHHSEYALSETRLLRTFDSGSATAVGRYITDVEYSIQGQIISITITSSPEGKVETAERKTYKVYLQLKEDPVQ